MKESNLDDILKKAEQEIVLSHKEILSLLTITSQKELNRVTAIARKLREQYFRNKVFLYGFVYFSTYCRNNCTFCLYRHSNKNILRYRKTCDEIMFTAQRLADSGVHLLDLTMGEDPQYHNSKHGFSDLIHMVSNLKREAKTPIMISPGVVSPEVLRAFRGAGADWYACYQETHNQTLYNRLRVEQSYDERLNSKIRAKEMGYLIEEGLLAGVGEANEDIADSIMMMKKIGADQVRVMTFVPQENTPLADWGSNSNFRELLIIAVMRLALPDCLIPASLDIDGLQGLGKRLSAGANVITSIIPPLSGLAGVSQNSLDIGEGNRTVEKVIPVLKAHNLEPATPGEYQAWVIARQAFLTNRERGGAKCG